MSIQASRNQVFSNQDSRIQIDFKQAGQFKLQGIGSSQTRIQGSKWTSNKQVNSSSKESGLLKTRFKDPSGFQTSRSIYASRNWSSQTKIQGSKWSSNKHVNPSFKESGLLKPRFKDPNGLQTSRSIQASRNQVFSNQDSRIQMVFKQAGQVKFQGIGSSQTKIQGSKWSSNKHVNPSFKESGLLEPGFKDPNGLQTSRSIQASRNQVFSKQDSRIQAVFEHAGLKKVLTHPSPLTQFTRSHTTNYCGNCLWALIFLSYAHTCIPDKHLAYPYLKLLQKWCRLPSIYRQRRFWGITYTTFKTA